MTEAERISLIKRYLDEVSEQFKSGHAIEHAYRPALKAFMSGFEDTTAVNDPKHSEHGAPDFIFLRKSNNKIIKGYAEAKDITISLDKTEKTDQMRRYHGYANLFLTDYLEFRFFRNGEKYETISLGFVKNGELQLTPQNGDRLIRELDAFLQQTPEGIRSGRRLAQIMGGKARRIRDNVSQYLTSQDLDSAELDKIYEMMKKMLVHDLAPEKFADMYAQTLVYGLFVARYSDTTPESFSRSEARDLVPKSNPFLQHFFDHIVGPNFDTRLAYIVDELCEIFSVSDVADIVHKHLRIQDAANDAKDPIIHFYEDFLQEYDSAERKNKGAYYTPIPVVKYIVRQVDRVLKDEFGLVDGLASNETVDYQIDTGQDLRTDRRQKLNTFQTLTVPRVQVLDPAVGTATFLNETIKFIHESFVGQQGRWPSYVHQNLLKRLHGFELMMAPYTIAHLKLGMTLKEMGVSDLQNRLGVYLTNTLEEGIPTQQDLFNFGLAEAVSEESRLATEVKNERPVMVVMGNPPYSGESFNKTEFANSLIDKYKFEPGGQLKLNEPNAKWLYNDYVKFIAFAEDMVVKNKAGIVAMITDNSYLERLTFRGMRWKLAQTFDKIYILDLHGSSKKKETAPDGSNDENVFDIMQGVSIIVAVKKSDSQELVDVYHADIYGTRPKKFKALEEPITWQKLALDEKTARFVPRNTLGLDEYEKGIPVNELFIESGNGVVTKRDKLAIQDTKLLALQSAEDIVNMPKEEFYSKYHLPADVRDWRYEWAKTDVLTDGPDEKFVRMINYRPFDKRYIYFTGRSRGFIGWPVMKIMNNYLDKENVGLLVSRMTQGKPFTHGFVTQDISEAIFLSPLTGTNAYNFPLWIYHDDGTRTPNFNPKLLAKFTVNLSSEPKPDDIFNYIYATLFSPSFREKYKYFLTTDFPRIPLPLSDDDFYRLAGNGSKLRELHLMKSSTSRYDTTFSVAGDNVIEKLSYNDAKVWINDKQYFGNVPQVAWDFSVGGYQPAQKWLKDRKGRVLSGQDLDHYQKIIKVLLETDRIMHATDTE